jgi:hypothetical protein
MEQHKAAALVALLLTAIGTPQLVGSTGKPLPYGPPRDAIAASFRYYDAGTTIDAGSPVLSCLASVNCATIECDMMKEAMKMCDEGQLVFLRECADGFVAVGYLDMSFASYYKASKLMAVVQRRANLGTFCSWGPNRFTEPSCGPPVPVCSTDAGRRLHAGG